MESRWVALDVGETLVDEAATYERWEAEGVTTFVFEDRDLHSDVLPCFEALRAHGLRLGAAGNMYAHHEDFLRPRLDFVGSSERWGVEKPAAAFFERIVDAVERPAAEIAYIGDRVDNDVLPAKRAGMFAVHVRRFLLDHASHSGGGQRPAPADCKEMFHAVEQGGKIAHVIPPMV